MSPAVAAHGPKRLFGDQTRVSRVTVVTPVLEMSAMTTAATRPRRFGGTAGIVMLGAGVVVTAPTTAPPEAAVRAVELVAGLFEPYADLVTNTVANLETVGAHWLADPLPILTQVIANWLDYGHTTSDAFVAAGQSLVDGVVNLPDQLQTLFDALQAGDIEEALAELVIIGLSVNPGPALVDQLLTIPYAIAGNLVNAALAAVHALQVPVGVAGLAWLQATFGEAELVGHDFVDDLQTGDLAGAFAQLVNAPAQLLNAALNSDTPGLEGLLAPFQDLDHTGFVDAVLNYLPQTVAQAIGAPEDVGP
jgi:hypothetical protein